MADKDLPNPTQYADGGDTAGLPAGFTLDQTPGSQASDLPPGFQLDEDKYGTIPQQALTIGEGFARGILSSPVTAAAEEGLTALGVPGLSPAEQKGRREINPWESGLSEAGGFAIGARYGLGGARAVIGAGELAAKVTGLGLEGASTISKIAAQGIKTGTEMAALQSGDEAAKLINQDPDQSLGSAAINIGLSGIMGSVGGAALGAVGPLWKSSMEKMGAPKLIDDAKAQYNFRQSIPNGGDVTDAITSELDTRLSEAENMRQQMSSLKSESLARLMPEATEENIAKANSQAQKLMENVQNSINSLGDDPLAEKLQKRLNVFASQISTGAPIEAIEPFVSVTPNFSEIPETVLKASRPTPQRLSQIREAGQYAQAENLSRANSTGYNPYDISQKYYQPSPEQVFNSINSFKNQLQEWSKFSKIISPPISERAFIGTVKNLSHDFKSALENPEIWNDAALVQLRINSAIKNTIGATQDAVSKFTQKSALEGGRVVDPAKVNTLVNQSLKGKAGLKGDFIDKYVKYTDDLADTINKIHTDAGLEAPIRLTPTPVLNHTLKNSSPGITLGNWLYDKGLATIAGDVSGGAAGAGLGSLVGHPALGAVIGERVLSPTLTAIAKPLLENASRSEALKGTIDYVANVIKGQKVLSNATKNLLSGAEILPKDLIPDAESREKLKSSLEAMNNPEHALSVAGNLNHYLPSHGTAAAAMAAKAANYFRSLKPVQPQAGPLDKPSPPSRPQEQKYNRALDVAQQPLMALKYARNGTLQQQDVDVLQNLYPQVHSKIVSQLYPELVKAKTDGKQISYKQRQSLSLLMGTPLDSTLSQPVRMNIMAANAMKGPPPQSQGGPKRVSHSTASSMSKVNQMYATTEQAGAARRTEKG